MTMDAARCVQIKQRMGMVQSLFLSVFGNAMNKKWEHDVSLSQCFPRFKQRGTVQREYLLYKEPPTQSIRQL